MGTFLVTGTSTGIGYECALRLARAGHVVYAGVRKESDAESLRAEAPDHVRPLTLDVTDDEQVEAAAKRIESEVGELQGVVNNAGVAKAGPIEFLPVSEWRDQLDVNVVGQVAVTRAMLPLIRKGSGRIVFIGSIGGKIATMMMGPYNASKFAIEAIGDSLRQELRPWGIRVAIIEPGAIKTPIWEKGRDTADRLRSSLPADAVQLYEAHIVGAEKAVDQQERVAIHPGKVADAVEHALFSSRPKTRYPVGRDAKVMTILARLVPDRPRDAIVRRVTGP